MILRSPRLKCAARILGALLIATSKQSAGQSATLDVGVESYSRYPSMNPVTAITVSLAEPSTYQLLKMAYAQGWNCNDKTNYLVTFLDTKNGKKITRDGAVTDIVLEGDDDTMTNRLTSCTLGRPGELQLIISSILNSSETIQVSLLNLPAGYAAKSDGKLQAKSTSPYSFTATPQAAPAETLTDGNKKDTGQLNVAFADADLLPGHTLPSTVYAKSTDLFSTNEKDSKSSFSSTLGTQFGLLPTWYSLVHFEQSVQGNQTATNLSTVSTAGFTTLLPWSWSQRLFNNRIVQAPLPPDLTVDNQYTHRINQLSLPKSVPLATDDYAANPYMGWSGVQYPWACKVFSWIDSIGRSTKVDFSGQYCLGTEVNLGMFFLPLDRTSSGSRRVEGYGDISILIPLSKLEFASRFFPYLTSDDPMKTQIRIKYADSVTAANNYARSRHWTYGIELMK